VLFFFSLNYCYFLDFRSSQCFCFLLLLPSVVGLWCPSDGLLLGAGLLGVLLLLASLIWVTVEEEIHGNLPWDCALDVTAETENFAGEQPVHHADGVATTVVAWDCNVDVLEWRVGVAEGNDRDVHLCSFRNGLVVRAWVGDNDQAWLQELWLDLVGECTWNEAASAEVCASVLSKLEDGALSEETNGASNDVLWVLDGGNDTSCEEEFLPCHVEVDDMHAILGAGIDVLVHCVGDVLCAKVGVCGEETLHGGLTCVENLAAGWDGGHFFREFVFCRELGMQKCPQK